MKDTVKMIQTYLTFDAPLEIESIRTTFALTQDQQQKIIPSWGTDSTRQKLISIYWFRHVLYHFGVILGVSFVFTFLITRRFDSSAGVQLLIGSFFGFITLLFFHYLPNFTSDYLPKVDAVRSAHESRQQREIIMQLREQLSAKQEQIAWQQQLFQNQLHEQSVMQQRAFQVELQQELADQEARISKQQERTQRRFQEQVTGQKALLEQQQEELKKCRQAQLSNFALTLVYFAWVKGLGIWVDGSDHTAQLLQKLYGVDRGSLRNNLDLIAGSSSKRKNLGERKLTEMRIRFDEATIFFKEMGYTKGITILKELEIKILGS